jgi:hypothetical protein
MNKQWHLRNKIPKNANAQRRWHEKHAEYCGCRPIPKSLLKEVENKKEK